VRSLHGPAFQRSVARGHAEDQGHQGHEHLAQRLLVVFRMLGSKSQEEDKPLNAKEIKH